MHKRRVPRRSSTMPIAAPIPRRRCAPTAPISKRSSCASASWSTFPSASSRTTILGEPAALPLILAPIGLCGMQHGDGEIHACRAAQAAGIPFTLSTMSICSIEDVAAAVDKPFWFQLYVMKDRGFIKALIERAIAAKCSALVLTVDLQVIGQRHQDIKNGMTVPPEWSLSKLLDIATKPAWVAGVLRGKRRTFGNIAGHVRGMENVNSLSQWIASQFDTCAELEGRRVDPQHLAGQAHPQGHSRRRGRRARGEDRRAGAGGLQPWRPAARRRAVVDLGAAGDRRRGRLLDGDHVRRRHPLRPGRDARAGARRQLLHDRPRLRLRSRRRRPGRRRQGDRHHPQRTATSPWDCAASTPSPRSTITCWRLDRRFDQTVLRLFRDGDHSGRRRSRSDFCEIGFDQRAQLRRHVGALSEPQFKSTHRLVQQHAEPVSATQSTLLGRRQQPRA